MSHLHFLFLLFFALNFSASPAPGTGVSAATVKSINLPSSREEDAEFIPWMDERRLTWEDFLSEPRKHSDAVASTSTSLGIAYQVAQGALEYKITCNFSKTKSWGLLKTDYILAHEQGHFDITEIFARKLYQEMQQYAFNRKTYKRDINELYQSIVKEKEAMQAAYDGESDHSRNRKLQYEWLAKIDQLLIETASYAAYP